MKNLFILLIIIFPLVTSCQKKLERGEAKKMITERFHYPIKYNYEITKSYIKDMNTQGNGVTVLLDEEKSNQKVKNIEQFVSMGLLKLRQTPKRQESSNFLLGTTIRTWTAVDVSLTETGKKYLVQEQTDVFVVKLWEIHVNEITGIQEMSEQKSAKVDYTLLNKNITPFGSIFSDRNNITQKSAYFSLYDDGWRLQ